MVWNMFKVNKRDTILTSMTFLILNIFCTLSPSFFCWLWTGKCLLDGNKLLQHTNQNKEMIQTIKRTNSTVTTSNQRSFPSHVSSSKNCHRRITPIKLHHCSFFTIHSISKTRVNTSGAFVDLAEICNNFIKIPWVFACWRGVFRTKSNI